MIGLMNSFKASLTPLSALYVYFSSFIRSLYSFSSNLKRSMKVAYSYCSCSAFQRLNFSSFFNKSALHSSSLFTSYFVFENFSIRCNSYNPAFASHSLKLFIAACNYFLTRFSCSGFSYGIIISGSSLIQ